VIKVRAILGRRWLILVIATLLGMAAGLVSTLFTSKDTRVLYIAEQVVAFNPTSNQASNLAQDALKVTRGEVPDAAATKLGRPGDGQALAGKVEAKSNEVDRTIKITSTMANPDEAKRMVDVFGSSFLEVINADLLKDQERQLSELQKQVDITAGALRDFDTANPVAQDPASALSTDARVKGLAEQRAQFVNALNDAQGALTKRRLETRQSLPYSALGAPTVKPAESGLLNIPASKVMRGSLLGLVGLLLGVGLVMVIERTRQRIDTREELVEAIKLPVLAEIGKLPRSKRAKRGDPLELEGQWAEPYRRVRAAIQFVQLHPETPEIGVTVVPPRVFLVTSAHPGEGKSTTCALTALALAEIAMPTVVVGGDFRRPQVESYLAARRSPSLQDHAAMSPERASVDEVVMPASVPNLWVAASGKPTREVSNLVPPTLDLIRECARRGATVIVDSPPLQAANDTVDMLPVVDQVILVVRSGEATAAGLKDSVGLLEQHDAKVLGIVLVGTPGVGKLQSYYESYYLSGQTVEQPVTPMQSVPDMSAGNGTAGTVPTPIPPPLQQAGSPPQR
jgi:Mrp family chromosome partitioning ATPase